MIVSHYDLKMKKRVSSIYLSAAETPAKEHFYYTPATSTTPAVASTSHRRNLDLNEVQHSLDIGSISNERTYTAIDGRVIKPFHFSPLLALCLSVKFLSRTCPGNKSPVTLHLSKL